VLCRPSPLRNGQRLWNAGVMFLRHKLAPKTAKTTAIGASWRTVGYLAAERCSAMCFIWARQPAPRMVPDDRDAGWFATGLRGDARQHFGQDDAARLPATNRSPVWQGRAHLGDGPRHPDPPVLAEMRAAETPTYYLVGSRVGASVKWRRTSWPSHGRRCVTRYK
jgi:hypothetical protein